MAVNGGNERDKQMERGGARRGTDLIYVYWIAWDRLTFLVHLVEASAYTVIPQTITTLTVYYAETANARPKNSKCSN
jgi:hypothetical protein